MGIKPVKGLSQHFLTDQAIASRIVSSMNIPKGAHVLEIGPGQGAITSQLAQSGMRKLTLVELDHRFVIWLQAAYGTNQAVQMIEGDILKQDIAKICEGEKIIIAGNIPYSITSPILFFLLENRQHIQSATVMVQKEVAERWMSPPGNKAYGIPTVLFSLYSNIEKVCSVSRKAFNPQPMVDSTVIQIEFPEKPNIQVTDINTFKILLKTAFGQRRKMLKNTIGHLVKDSRVFLNAGLNEEMRPEQVSPESWALLHHAVLGQTDDHKQ